MSMNQLWFVKHEGMVIGHFPIKEIARAISTGEVAPNDEISPDQVNWIPLNRFPGLAAELPLLQAEETLGDEEKQWRDERVKAAQRWETPVEHHNFRAPSHSRLKWLGAVAALSAVAGLALFVAFQWQLSENVSKALIVPPIPACDVAPAPKINWRGCDKSGMLLRESDLSSANLSRTKLNSTDLSGSRLLSSNLSQADLSYATLDQANMAHANLEGSNLNFTELRDADLSHVNLRNANLTDTVLDGAKLDEATWTDGRICAAGSIGQCR